MQVLKIHFFALFPFLCLYNVVEELFESYDEQDTQRMDEMYEMLGKVDVDVECPKYSIELGGDLIKYVPDRIRSFGYPCEVHKVVTPDGYMLELHRIPFGLKSREPRILRPAVLLMHGFLESSNCFVVLGPKDALAFKLADEGYDVWMVNARGTEASRKHVSLNAYGSNRKEYWSFSWHEIGIYDLTTCIDYVLGQTKQEKLNFVGYSQGTTAFLVMATMRPEYNEKIIAANLMAPVAFMRGKNHPIVTAIAHFYTPLKKMLEILGVNKISLNNNMLLQIADIVCARALHTGCKIVQTLIDSVHINDTSIPYILLNVPAGASLRQGVHFIQLVKNGGFRQFDYDDMEMNQQVYGNNTPPDYDLSRVTTPVNLYHSMEDTTSQYENVLLLKSYLPNVKSKYLIPIADFRHVDFVYSKQAGQVVNSKIIDVINDANPDRS